MSDEFDDVDFFFSADQADSEKVENDVYVDTPGKYHFEIQAVTKDYTTVTEKGAPKHPTLRVRLRVLHSTPGQSPEGAIMTHNVKVAGKGGHQMEQWEANETVSFLLGIGYLQKVGEQIIDPTTKSTKIDFNSAIQNLVGWQFIGDVKKETNEDGTKTYYKFPWGKGCFTLDHQAVSNVPRNQDAATLFLNSRNINPKKKDPKQQPQQKAPEPVALSNGSIKSTGWDDL